MDLVNALSGLQQAQTIGAVQIRVAQMIMQDEQQQGDAAVQLIQAASNGVNGAGDALATAATGLGGSVDVKG